MAKKPKNKEDARTVRVHVRRMSFKNKFLLITFSLVMMGLLRTGFVFFVIGMMPSIVAYYMDVTKHRYIFRTIFAANMSGMLPFITKLIERGPSGAFLEEVMGDMTTWIIIYGSAFIGWLLVKTCPIFAQIMVIGVHQTQIMRYQWLQKQIEGEWGTEVSKLSAEYSANRN
jgi:hypothetical protein